MSSSGWDRPYDDAVPAELRAAGCTCSNTASPHSCPLHVAAAICPDCRPIHASPVITQGGEAGRLGHRAVVHGESAGTGQAGQN